MGYGIGREWTLGKSNFGRLRDGKTRQSCSRENVGSTLGT